MNLAKMLLVALIVATMLSTGATAAQNGGAKCAACTIIVGLIEQTMQVHSINATSSMDLLCSYMPSPVNFICDLALTKFKPIVVPLVEKGETADVVCNAMKWCVADTATCRLFPNRQGSDLLYAQHVERIVHRYDEHKKFNICETHPQVCRVADHLPYYDNDGDKFSTHTTLRGTYFRGKDCNDSDATVYPGRNSSDYELDANCNGIYGIDNTTGMSYEDQWCANSGAMGVAALGDSATAHFRFPDTYFTASEFSKETFAGFLRFLEDEADWPMLSWSTGHLNTSEFNPDVKGPMKSLYSLMLERNRCNHRDYQNLGVNGARVDMLKPFDMLLERNKTANVKPLLAIYSMVGNDVCNGHHTFSTMTTPKEYFDRIVAALYEADTFLPTGSKVIIVPLVDGRILYSNMYNRIHPIGRLNKDVTYTDFYDYLNCLDISPCWGWLNSNETVRNTTWEIANSLNEQIPKIIEATNNTLKHIEVHYLGQVYGDAINSYPGPKWEMIEPSDGFHPSQLANSIIGETIFNRAVKAGIIPPPNPYNDEIIAKFGDQGGY